MENIKDFTIAVTFIIITSVCLLFFALGYPALNGHNSVLLGDSKFNQTATDLANSLGNYNNQMNTNVNISNSDQPQVVADSLQLVSTTAVSRNILGQTAGSFKILTTMLGNVFGLSGTQFAFIGGALISLFTLVILYYVIREIRIGQ
jgi:hypothetical protein